MSACDKGPADVERPAVIADAEVDSAPVIDAELVPDVAVDAAPPAMDLEGPAWPEGVEIEVVKTHSDSVILSWPAAADDGSVARYEVIQDEVSVAVVEGWQTAAEVGGLVPMTQYVFWITAYDDVGNASANDPFVVVMTPDEHVPYWPDGSTLTVSDVTDRSVVLRWSLARDDVAVTRYRLFRDNIELDTTAADVTDYEVSGLESGTTYRFRVEAEDAAGGQSAGGPWVTVDLLDVTPPVWPEDGRLEASLVTPVSLSLGWTPATDNIGVVQYVIERDGQALATTQPPVSWLAVEGLSPWSEYRFTVSAVDGAGNRSAVELAIDLSTPDQSVPTWPMGSAISVSNPQATEVTLGWGAADDDVAVTGYRIYRDLVLVATLGADERSWTALGLSQDMGYAFSVQAVDGAGNESRSGPTLQVQLNDENAPIWPAGAALTVSDVTATSVALGWPAADDDIGVAAYAVMANQVEVRTVSGDLQGTVVDGLLPNTTYTFAVTAGDAAGNLTADALTAEADTLDLPVPTWPADSLIEVVAVEETQVTLSWRAPAAEVAQYTVWRDGALAATIDAPATEATIQGLEGASVYQFQVQAVGPTGLVSVDGPTLDVRTLDGEAPVWPEGSTVAADEVGPSHVVLSWDAADDNVAVVEYVVSGPDARIWASTGGEVRMARVEGLTAETDYLLSVGARDEAGNLSMGGPSVAFTTPAAPVMGPTTADVMARLGASCGPCHTAGAQERIAYFASEMAFVRLIAEDEAYVVPGDPDGSGLVHLLEGTAQGPVWTQMPLPPSPPFSEVADAQISMEEIRQWITDL